MQLRQTALDGVRYHSGRVLRSVRFYVGSEYNVADLSARTGSIGRCRLGRG